MDKFTLKLLAAIAIGGVLHRAGSIVELPEREATDLLRRGKAEPAESEPLEADFEEQTSAEDPEGDKGPEGDKDPEGDKGPEGDAEKSDDPAEKPGKKAKS